jgi:hypothetical protein
MSRANISIDDRTVLVRVPISVRRRGDRKLALAPNGANVTLAAMPRRSLASPCGVRPHMIPCHLAEHRLG